MGTRLGLVLFTELYIFTLTFNVTSPLIVNCIGLIITIMIIHSTAHVHIYTIMI